MQKSRKIWLGISLIFVIVAVTAAFFYTQEKKKKNKLRIKKVSKKYHRL